MHTRLPGSLHLDADEKSSSFKNSNLKSNLKSRNQYFKVMHLDRVHRAVQVGAIMMSPRQYRTSPGYRQTMLLRKTACDHVTRTTRSLTVSTGVRLHFFKTEKHSKSSSNRVPDER